jgi:L-alanine-DL-glutamate epimerase-like enolase superfamily enzyme
VKIKDIKLTAFRRPTDASGKDMMIKGFSVRSLLSEIVAVQVFTDEGFVGENLSLGGGLGLAHYIAHNIKPMLIGRDPEYLEALWQDMWELNRLWFTPQFAIGTVEVALWDLFGKILNRPIYKILGAYRDKLPVYGSSMTKETAALFVEEALKYKERGFHGYKLHPVGEPKFDIACCLAVRKAVGDDYTLMLDAVSAYNQGQALYVGRAIEEMGFYWFEEPMREYDIHGYRMLADKLDIPIMGVENNEGGLYTTAEFITTRAIDIVRSDVTLKYGVGQVKKTAALAEAFGMNLEVHTNPNPMLDAANLQVALTIKNTDFFEQFVSEHIVRYGVKEWLQIDKEGYVHPPRGAGHGLEIDWDFVNAHTISVL